VDLHHLDGHDLLVPRRPRDLRVVAVASHEVVVTPKNREGVVALISVEPIVVGLASDDRVFTELAGEVNVAPGDRAGDRAAGKAVPKVTPAEEREGPKAGGTNPKSPWYFSRRLSAVPVLGFRRKETGPPLRGARFRGRETSARLTCDPTRNS
jgi:hypothetical protein